MLNQIICVGRLLETQQNERGIEITVSIPRQEKNKEGIYENDNVKVQLIGIVAERTLEYCKKGDIIGIRGRIRVEKEKQFILGEKITFLSSKSKEVEESM